jgi:hypothetical protein
MFDAFGDILRMIYTHGVAGFKPVASLDDLAYYARQRGGRALVVGDLQQDSDDVLGGGPGGDEGRGFVPIHVGACHLVSVLEAEARKLEFAPLNRQVIGAGALRETGERLRVELRPLAAHEGTSRSMAKAPRGERSNCASGRSPIVRSRFVARAGPPITARLATADVAPDLRRAVRPQS